MSPGDRSHGRSEVASLQAVTEAHETQRRMSICWREWSSNHHAVREPTRGRRDDSMIRLSLFPYASASANVCRSVHGAPSRWGMKSLRRIHQQIAKGSGVTNEREVRIRFTTASEMRALLTRSPTIAGPAHSPTPMGPCASHSCMSMRRDACSFMLRMPRAPRRRRARGCGPSRNLAYGRMHADSQTVRRPSGP